MNRIRRFRKNTNARGPRAPFGEPDILQGHPGEAFASRWNPIDLIVATVGADSTVRLWDMDTGKQLVLRHGVLSFRLGTQRVKGAFTMDWNASGSLLATGSIDGYARIWNKNGELTERLEQNIGAIVEVKWNKTENYILCAGAEGTSVWHVPTQSTRQFYYHDREVMDIDWRADDIFASCGRDGKIFVSLVNEGQPFRRFFGHIGDVNAVAWNYGGNYLASCSDDTTVKVWGLWSNELVCNLTGHTKEVFTVKWCPLGGLNNYYLASGSSDSTVRIWDFHRGDCLHILEKHSQSVGSIDFSSRGHILVTGSSDQFIHIWSTRSGKLLQSHECSSGVTGVAVSHSGTTIAASTSDGTIVVFDPFKF